MLWLRSCDATGGQGARRGGDLHFLGVLLRAQLVGGWGVVIPKGAVCERGAAALGRQEAALHRSGSK